MATRATEDSGTMTYEAPPAETTTAEAPPADTSTEEVRMPDGNIGGDTGESNELTTASTDPRDYTTVWDWATNTFKAPSTTSSNYKESLEAPAATAPAPSTTTKAPAPAPAPEATVEKEEVPKSTDPVTNPYGVADPEAYVAPEYERRGRRMQNAAMDSYGENATDALRMATSAGRQYGNLSASEGGRQATSYARAAGLSPAQAALMAGQGAQSAYGTGLTSGVDRYFGAARDMGNLGTTQEGLGLQKYSTDLNAALQKYGLDIGKYGTDVSAQGGKYGVDAGIENQQSMNWMNMLGTLFSAAAPVAGVALSDETAKTDIKDGYGILEQVTKVVNPKTFKYKPGVGEDSTAPRVGVMAQDLEKTPLASTVKTGEDGMKRVDTAQLSLGNTAMISELSQKLDKVFDYLKAAK
jgi:hypothetical protein